jgi:hypothetical protein
MEWRETGLQGALTGDIENSSRVGQGNPLKKNNKKFTPILVATVHYFAIL